MNYKVISSCWNYLFSNWGMVFSHRQTYFYVFGELFLDAKTFFGALWAQKLFFPLLGCFTVGQSAMASGQKSCSYFELLKLLTFQLGNGLQSTSTYFWNVFHTFWQWNVLFLININIKLFLMQKEASWLRKVILKTNQAFGAKNTFFFNF